MPLRRNAKPISPSIPLPSISRLEGSGVEVVVNWNAISIESSTTKHAIAEI